jgi:hypothetical protein
MVGETDIEGDVGPIDDVALAEVRSVFEGVDTLVETTGFDSRLDPTKLQIHLVDGIGDATWCRFDVRWFQNSYYSFHHVDEAGVNVRYDYHPKPGAPDKHFHRPPDADSEDVERSCISTTEPVLVSRAVHSPWRRAYDTSSLAHLNAPRTRRRRLSKDQQASPGANFITDSPVSEC